MIAFQPSPAAAPWQTGFLALLPAIRSSVGYAFRHLPPEAREDAVQEAIATALLAYVRLVELGKTELAYASPLARHAVAHVRAGRQVGNCLRGRDVLSPYAQRQKRFTVERLDHFDEQAQAWQEVLVEDRRSTPAEIAASRMDVAAWLATLPVQLRKVAQVLATGETTKGAAEQFQVSPGRISQIRRALHDTWHAFHHQLPQGS